MMRTSLSAIEKIWVGASAAVAALLYVAGWFA